MIHFRCRCGATLSVEEERNDGTVRCAKCGAAVAVPRVAETGGVTPRRDTPPHDFDAEIVSAARTRPPRRLKTPEDRKAPESSPDPPPDYDLLRVRRAPGLLRGMAVVGLLALPAASVVLLRFGSGSLWWRAAVALLLLVLAAALVAGLTALAEVCRALTGLAERQREITLRMEEKSRAGSGPGRKF